MKKILKINGVALTYVLIQDASGMRIVATDAQGNEQSVVITSYHFDAQAGMLSLTTPSGAFVFHVTSSQDSDGTMGWAVTPVPGIHTHKVHDRISLEQRRPGDLVPSRRGKEQYLVSPLAGRVSKVMVTVGQRVSRGTVILLIESMKMENELCAQGDAVIKTIFIAEADVVKPNQLLVEFEKEGDVDATPQSPDGT